MVMSLIPNISKKKCKFNVKLTIHELLGVTFISGLYYCKVRQINGGSFKSETARCEVFNTSVTWKQTFSFDVKLVSNGEIKKFEDCLIRISVRKEIKGGKTCQKLGFIDYNLSDYLNRNGILTNLLKGYDTKTRYNNSYLKTSIDVQQNEKEIETNLNNLVWTGVSLNENSTKTDGENAADSQTRSLGANEYGHSRNSSKGSTFSLGHRRNISNGSVTSGNSDPNSRSRARRLIDNLNTGELNPRIIETRVDHYDVVDQIESELNQILEVESKTKAGYHNQVNKKSGSAKSTSSSITNQSC